MCEIRRIVNAGFSCMVFMVAMSFAMQSAWPQESGKGRHKRMFAVPAPGKVTVDGNLDDWDLSAQIECYVLAGTRATQNGKIALMFDDEALYVSGDVRDPSPMMNRHAPEVEGDVAWDADAFQFRLVVDPSLGYPIKDSVWSKDPSDQVIHLLMWYFTDRQEPNLQIKVSMKYKDPPGCGKFGVIPKDKFQAAYKMSEDRKGYVFEYKIPWGTVGAKQPLKGGDVVAATYQLLWGRADGLKTAPFSGWGYDLMSGGGFAYQDCRCWGKLIISKEGHVARELVEDGTPPEKPMPLTFEYELPEDGETTIALINDMGEVVRLLAAQAPRFAGHQQEKWDGMDDMGRPLPPGTYSWKGLYHQPIALKHVLSVHNSGQPPYMTDDNAGSWGGDHGAPSAVCTAGDDLILAWNASEAGFGIIRTDTEGKKKWGGRSRVADHIACDGERLFIVPGAEPGVYASDARDCRNLAFGNGMERLAPPPGGDENSNRISGLACCGGTVFVAFQERGIVALYDSRGGELKKTWEITAPGAMAARKDGALAMISAGRLVSVKDGQVSPIASEHLDHPAGVAVAPDGSIFVSSQGKLQNVSVFSAEGKYLRSIGKEGGRPEIGLFDPAGMLDPKGLAVDAKGRLWVAEAIDSPKRFSVWDPKTGALAKEFFGGAHYSAFIWMDPGHPDEIFCDSVIWKVDLDKKTWAPHSTCWRTRWSNENQPDAIGGISTHGDGLRVFTARNGRQYGWARTSENVRYGSSEHSTVLFMRDGDVFRPVLAVCSPKIPVIGKLQKSFGGLSVGGQGASYAWADSNGDMIIQENELSPPIGTAYEEGFNWVDRDLNLWFAYGLCKVAKTSDGKGYTIARPAGKGSSVCRPVRIEADGRPVYDFGKAEDIPIRASYIDDQDDARYTCRGDKSPGVEGRYCRYSADGKLQWSYRGVVDWISSLTLPPMKPGQLFAPTSPLGTAGEFTGWNTYYGIAHVYTRDGLYVARLFTDVKLGGKTGPEVIACENMNGQLVKPKGMERYFFLGGDVDGRVTEVLGLDSVKHLEGGTYTVTDADAQMAAEAFSAYQALLAKAQKLEITHGRKTLESAASVGKTVAEDKAFQARLAYDSENLYVQYEVTSPSELINSETDPQLIFKGGNLIDLQIAADPSADPKRTRPAPGDMRILITRQKDPGGRPRPIAVIYRPKLKDFKGAQILLRSPGQQETFDSIEVSEKIGLEYEKGGGSFKAVAAVPLSLLGLELKSGTPLRMDVGYIFGNPTGTKAVARSYWTNNSFTANILNDVPHESRLEPDKWGSALVE